MTTYQKKRRFINKINQRIKTLVNKAGVNPEVIEDKLSGIDGIWITDTGNLNIDTSYFTPELQERIEKLIPTYMEEYNKAVKKVMSESEHDGSEFGVSKAELDPNFIGPSSLKFKAHRVIQTKWDFEYNFDSFVRKFYDWEDNTDPIEAAKNPRIQEIYDYLSELGSMWAHEPDFFDLGIAASRLNTLAAGIIPDWHKNKNLMF